MAMIMQVRDEEKAGMGAGERERRDEGRWRGGHLGRGRNVTCKWQEE